MKVLATFIMFISSLAARGDLGTVDCDELANNLVANSNLTGTGRADQILTIKNGKAEINKKSPRILDFKTEGNETTLTFKRQIPINGFLTDIQETVRFLTNEQGYIINYLADTKAAPPGMLGQKATVKRVSAQLCTMEQFSALMRGNSNRPTEVVSIDRVYCQSVEGIMKELGKASFDQCHDLLQKASQAYNQRALSLSTEQKLFVESGIGNTMQAALNSLNTCGPQEWYETMTTPMGNQRVLKLTASTVATSGTSASGNGTR